jgi:hypothetical protein
MCRRQATLLSWLYPIPGQIPRRRTGPNASSAKPWTARTRSRRAGRITRTAVPSNPAHTVRWRAAENSAAKAFSPKAAWLEGDGHLIPPGAGCRDMRKIEYARLPVRVRCFSYRLVCQYISVVGWHPDNRCLSVLCACVTVFRVNSTSGTVNEIGLGGTVPRACLTERVRAWAFEPVGACDFFQP